MFLLRVRPAAPVRRYPLAATPHVTTRLYTPPPVAADLASDAKAKMQPGADGDGAGTAAYTYLKQQEVTPEPRVSPSGTRTYVVSPKDSAPYNVPGGAYGSSDPYLSPPPTPAPQTSAPVFVAPGAHTTTINHVPHHSDGESANVRLRTVPGSSTQSPSEAALAGRSGLRNQDAGPPRQE